VIQQQILNFRNIKEFMSAVKHRLNPDHHERQSLERRIGVVDTEIKKVMKLYRLGTIDENEIEKELLDLQARKADLESKLQKARVLDSFLTVAKMKFCDFKHITGLKKFLAPQFAL
jgi:septal ring factor EnvC (AmiA/AmiB activator)